MAGIHAVSKLAEFSEIGESPLRWGKDAHLFFDEMNPERWIVEVSCSQSHINCIRGSPPEQLLHGGKAEQEDALHTK